MNEKDQLLRKYLDNELSSEEEKEALHTIADDEHLRSMLRFEHQLEDKFVGNNNTSVPEGFTDQVMHQVGAEQTEEHVSISERLRKYFQYLWVPQQISLRPVYAFSIALLVLAAFSYSFFLSGTFDSNQPVIATNNSQVGKSVQQVSSDREKVMMRFMYVDEEAKSIAVAGDFSDWEPIEMSKQVINGKTIWTGLVSMSRGKHNYMFVKNGDKWVTDPLATVQHEDGFGNKNAVVYL
ncbi:Glycogen recognition site of AMP-activated protein kinase [Fodinibius salinus]|uniref:Glycogen recognition site of AMP-activated protein kinase n=1 Tax=Fodinibius salinus TaxID=860790 RepID=A0A5D3YQL2_9BACT|nr:hypothetical protein [Fodinibius salinus]TYP95273.1 Glycogen recognition site of AMP-activated protein kinase [Fodinibius salinus]